MKIIGLLTIFSVSWILSLVLLGNACRGVPEHIRRARRNRTTISPPNFTESEIFTRRDRGGGFRIPQLVISSTRKTTRETPRPRRVGA
ncbi:hypothetical protein Y032_0306g1990 [Ancylostoma ceylanicum]|uniref:Secreted protein n=1 Tax=Ancylostoma ceylanicum TaxID=53326 RepID=A0A016S2X8_9BILA|nr:hypothetical protein Y032_0306g1990 [Ancylostoma ceylanicum]